MSARLLAAALLATVALPVAAQAQTERQVPPVVIVPVPSPSPQPDPARLAAAGKVVTRLVPEGIYKRMLGDNFGQMIGATMDALGDIPVHQFLQFTGIGNAEAEKLGQGTIKEVVAIYDPHWQKRMTATTTAFSGVMTRVATKMEPSIRKALSRAYAREFSVAELAEMDRFFSTPAGAHYAAKSLELAMDPEMIQAMTEMMPEMMAMMPEITKEMEAVEASLPKPRKYKDLTPADQKRLTELLGVDAETLEAADSLSDDALMTDAAEDATAVPEALD